MNKFFVSTTAIAFLATMSFASANQTGRECFQVNGKTSCVKKNEQEGVPVARQDAEREAREKAEKEKAEADKAAGKSSGQVKPN